MSNAREPLRQALLLDAIVEPVNMSRIDSEARELMPSASTSERQADVVEAIRSLVDDGLVVTGYLGQEEDGFVVESLGEALAVIEAKYVSRYDEPAEWMWCCWLQLTDKGWTATTSTPEGQKVAEYERQRLEAIRDLTDAASSD